MKPCGSCFVPGRKPWTLWLVSKKLVDYVSYLACCFLSTTMKYIFTFVLILSSLSSAVASAGDNSPIFQLCVDELLRTHCPQGPQRSLASILTSWHCLDESRYECMHAITDMRSNKGEETLQYYGKWPFWRVMGMQEPASVIFSLMNLAVHWQGALLVKRRIPDAHPMKIYYVAWSYTSINAWVWSSVFHTRGVFDSRNRRSALAHSLLDLPSTEKLDYFSAAATILYAFYAVVVRFFHLYPLPPTRLSTSKVPPSSPTHSRAWVIWTSVCALTYLGHLTYLLSLSRFDYTYNMAFGVGVGIAHNLLWTAYSLPSRWTVLRRFPFKPFTYRPPYVSKAAVFVALTMAATGLELFDFPPWRRTIDAHSLWHFVTVPISIMWYNFLVEDATDDGWRDSTSPQ
jgi:post-GPI attachment to proteins factor 3